MSLPNGRHSRLVSRRVAPPRLTRRGLLKAFGPAALLMLPIARSMGYVAGGSFASAPRFVMFFRGASFHSPTVHDIRSLDALDGTPLAPLAGQQGDLVLFQNMHIHGGSPKSDGYKEEHGAGLIGCTTGNSYHYYENDSYMAYTDHESIDVRIRDHYQTRPELAQLPFSSLHIGAGARSDCDSCGLGQRYISYRKREQGDDYYSNAIEPVQDAGQVYDQLMQRISLICSADSNQPSSDSEAISQILERKRSVLDFRLEDVRDAQRALGVDSEHARKLEGLLEGWREVEAGLEGAPSSGVPGTVAACPAAAEFAGRGDRTASCDELDSVHDQMIALIQLAFSWDLTRVVAFTLSGASSGHSWPSKGIRQAHHSLEHGGDIEGLNTMGQYFSGKFAKLLDALRAVDDGDGHTALFNSSIILGMECWSDGDHSLRNIPFIFAGQGGGRFETGRIVDADGRSNNDLLVAIQNAAGIESEVFGLESLCKGAII